MMTFWGNPCFLPGLENSNFGTWRDKGISAIKDMFDPGGNIYSFEYLKDTYDIPNKDLFMYLQARHFTQSYPTLLKNLSTKDAFSETMDWLSSRPYKVRILYPLQLEPLLARTWATSLIGWSQDIISVDSSDYG